MYRLVFSDFIINSVKPLFYRTRCYDCIRFYNTKRIDLTKHPEYSLAAFSDGLINHYKSLIYEMIYKIKVDLNDKLKSLSLTVSPQMQEEYIHKAFSIIHTLNEIILSFTYYNKINS